MASSCTIVTMPLARASRGDLKLRDAPLRDIVPSSGSMTPEMIFPSVDLPAPFSPTSACTVPGLIVSDTSLRAAPRRSASNAGDD